jgi:hypothetical protein
MTDAVDQVPDRFTFSYADEAEFRAFYTLISQRQDQRSSWHGFYAVIVGGPVIIGSVPLAALAVGLIQPEAFKPVLATAFIAFIAGTLAFWWLVAVRYRAVARAAYRTGVEREVWEYTFDNAGIRSKNGTWEIRAPWSSAKSVEDAGAFVLIWLVNGQPFAIPSRLFADAGARRTFVAAIAARIAVLAGTRVHSPT